ncbi:hypothetical protein C8R47DRAFT_1313353 [Mycena vitilis]|nr:hypothetical protein C8R47DRAFT_1313353 [Mycena vitilis]
MSSVDDYRVYGYLFNDDQLLNYALKHKLGTDKTLWARTSAKSNAAVKILGKHNVNPYILAGVMVKVKDEWEVRLCAAIASENTSDQVPVSPSADAVKKLRQVFKAPVDPSWFHHV